ncbi:MAG: hypothetical protein CMH56_06235 [Myxococcales bacterium]|nr:hypothetical protein [Myxococcales bacterium]|tara:strand:+ start:1571 stop:2407 length:837 start_codon:yes stop_codon:yes gene_type:complete
MAIVAGILLLIAGVLIFFMRKNLDKIYHMKATETSTVQQLKEMAQSVRADMGEGPSHWNQQVELKGKVVCEHPLQGQFTDRPAVVVKTKIVREYEEYKESRDSEGKVTRRWVKRSDTLHDDTRDTSFSIDDGSGSIHVSPSGAEYTLESVVNRFEPPGAMDRGNTISIGGFSLSLGNMSFGSSRRLLGYRIKESILPVGSDIYALGEVRDGTDGLTLNDPSNKEEPFLLSVKSEEELLSQYGKTANIQKYAAIGLAAVSVGLVVWALLDPSVALFSLE